MKRYFIWNIHDGPDHILCDVKTNEKIAKIEDWGDGAFKYIIMSAGKSKWKQSLEIAKLEVETELKKLYDYIIITDERLKHFA